MRCHVVAWWGNEHGPLSLTRLGAHGKRLEVLLLEYEVRASKALLYSGTEETERIIHYDAMDF